jgi:hypothetical protein
MSGVDVWVLDVRDRDPEPGWSWFAKCCWRPRQSVGHGVLRVRV